MTINQITPNEVQDSLFTSNLLKLKLSSKELNKVLEKSQIHINIVKTFAYSSKTGRDNHGWRKINKDEFVIAP